MFFPLPLHLLAPALSPLRVLLPWLGGEDAPTVTVDFLCLPVALAPTFVGALDLPFVALASLAGPVAVTASWPFLRAFFRLG